jgi:AcrR family transcriptional regulator
MDTAATSLGERARQYSPAQRRTIAVALTLFVEHGVGDTSLQMIATAAGVTKAAIYHQFKTKEAIVLAVAEVELVGLEEAVDTALVQGGGPEARAQLLSRVIDIAVSRRRAVGTLLNDPGLLRYLNEQELYRRLMARLLAVLFGQEASDRSRVRAAVLAGAFSAGANHFVADLDDGTLRRELADALLPLLEERSR